MNPDCLRGFGRKLSKPKKPNKKDMLIAAAPDLLEACQAVMNSAICNGDMSISYAIDGAIVKQLMQAIQKAGAE